jgi:hypothetical protein
LTATEKQHLLRESQIARERIKERDGYNKPINVKVNSRDVRNHGFQKHVHVTEQEVMQRAFQGLFQPNRPINETMRSAFYSNPNDRENSDINIRGVIEDALRSGDGQKEINKMLNERNQNKNYVIEFTAPEALGYGFIRTSPTEVTKVDNLRTVRVVIKYDQNSQNGYVLTNYNLL